MSAPWADECAGAVEPWSHSKEQKQRRKQGKFRQRRTEMRRRRVWARLVRLGGLAVAMMSGRRVVTDNNRDAALLEDRHEAGRHEETHG